MENNFLNDFKNFLLQLPKVESGNFIKDIDKLSTKTQGFHLCHIYEQ